MEKSELKTKSVSPFLAISGVLLAIAGGIQLHSAILTTNGMILFSDLIGSPALSRAMINIESLVGTIAVYAGFVSLLILVARFSSVYGEYKKEAIQAIVLLVIFIALSAVVRFSYDLYDWYNFGSIWITFAVLTSYGILRGLAFQRINKVLKNLGNGYGNALILIYGWSFLITNTVSYGMILAGIYGFFGIIDYAIYGFMIQSFISGICMIIIGLKFLYDAFSKPTLQKSHIPGAPYIPPKKAPQEVLYQTAESALYNQPFQPAQSSQTQIIFCSFCGEKNNSTSKFCINCGQTVN